MSKFFLLSLILLTCSPVAVFAKADPVVEWVEKEIKDRKVSKKGSWNPGLSFLDETEVRIETDEDGVFSDQAVRLSLKPIFGLANEVRLTDQYNKILKLTEKNQESLSRLNSYSKILIFWSVQNSYKVLKQNHKIFEKAKRRIQAISQNSEVDLNSFIENLGYYEEMKTQYEELVKQMQAQGEAKKLLASLETMKLANPEKLKNYLNSANNIDLKIEKEKQELAELEYKKTKSESWQVVKFVQMSRQRDIRRFEDHRVQLSLRIPFLSDSTELREAETEYLQNQIKVRQESLEKEDQMKQLKAQALGMIQKYEIFKMVPDRSKNAQRFSSSLSTLDSTIDQEVKYIKLRLKKIETLLNIHASYLKILFLQGKLKKSDINYLTDIPKV